MAMKMVLKPNLKKEIGGGAGARALLSFGGVALALLTMLPVTVSECEGLRLALKMNGIEESPENLPQAGEERGSLGKRKRSSSSERGDDDEDEAKAEDTDDDDEDEDEDAGDAADPDAHWL